MMMLPACFHKSYMPTTSLLFASPPFLLPSPSFSKSYTSSRRSSFAEGHRQQSQPISAARSSPLPSSTSCHGLVFDVGPAPSWDSHEVGSPVVKRYVRDDEERWLMWYHGRGDEGDSIGVAVSGNGIHWERGSGPVTTSDDVGQVMRRSSDWWAFDTASVSPSDVLIMSSDNLTAPGAVYWLYYTGSSQEKLEIPCEDAGDQCRPRFVSLPGLAISQDGRHWARIEGEHHSGALFDAGSAGEWDALFAASPKVVYHGRGDLRMYYHSFDQRNGHHAVGIARSGDGIRWVKLGEVLGRGPAGSFDEAGARNAHVVRNQRDGSYLMAYEGVSVEGATRIGLAVSSDGLKNWRRWGDEVILEPSTDEDGWDSRGVGAPCLLQIMEGGGEEWRLYYTGIGKDGRAGIGMAVSEGSELGSFKKWVRIQL
ncbi:uncharacterized protein LOC103996730 [Musa acuminata AAA Group]|uniref:uncharacterized protein LOC103996730 n=1 Tax=Musa acuminata AAA Group TaxID=214697 RepID=UPI0031CE9F36